MKPIYSRSLGFEGEDAANAPVSSSTNANPSVNIGADPISAIAGAVGELAGIGRSAIDIRGKKQAAKSSLLSTALANKNSQSQARFELEKQKQKRKTIVVSSVVIGSIAIVGLLLYVGFKGAKRK